MSTYSIGAPPTDATKLADLQSVLNVLPDNTSKSISPKDVRDSIYTVWENSIFKPTTIPSSSVEYIGIDQNALKEKILIGNKQVSGQYVLSNNLLNSDADIFLYNTKNTAQYTSFGYGTKIAILSGTGSNFQSGNLSSPFLEAKVIVDGTSDFNIGNSSYIYSGGTYSGGNINIKSEYGVVSLNGLQFSSYLENFNNSTAWEGYVLKYRFINGNPYAKWESLGSQSSITSIISTGTVSITGNPVLLNGQNINFTDLTPVPTTIGGIQANATFSNVPVTDVLRQLIYPYVAPILTSSVNQSLVESGVSTPLVLNYSITRYATYSITSLTVTSPPNATSGSLMSPVSVGRGTTSSQVNLTIVGGGVLPLTQSWSGYTWTINMSDGITNRQSSSTVKVVIPWYYGSSSTLGFTGSGVYDINNILATQSTADKLTPILAEPAISSSSLYNKTLNISGNNKYFYFGYPFDFPDLSNIIDQNGFDVTSSFSKYIISNIRRPGSAWTGKTYKFYIYTGGGATPLLTSVGSAPSYTATYQFKFA